MESVLTLSDKKKPETLKNTLKCVAVLGLIAVVCVTLLAIANRFLKAEVTLDRATSDLINTIAPTGVSNDVAFNEGKIKMIDLSRGGYAVKSIDEYNKQYGSASRKVRALYTSTDADGKTTFVVEAEGKGYVDAVVMLVAYDADNKISGIVTKAQSESYWSHIKDIDKLYAAFIGRSGRVESSNIAASTGVTVMGTLGGMTGAVSIANDFVTRLGGVSTVPYIVTDAGVLTLLRKVSNAETFTCYPVGTDAVFNAYIGNNGDRIVEAHGNVGTYGQVTLMVRVADGKAAQLAYVSDTFAPEDGHDSSVLRGDDKLNELFAGKSLTDVNGMPEKNLAGSTGVTESGSGLLAAVKNALGHTFTQEGA